MTPTIDPLTVARTRVPDMPPTTTRHVAYKALVQLDHGEPYYVSGIFYLYDTGRVDFSIHNGRRVNASRRAPQSVLTRLRDAVLAFEERTCWRCLRFGFLSPTETCPDCEGRGKFLG